MLENLSRAYSTTRRFSEFLCEPLEIEDYVIQSMPDASPTRWHLAHTTWFFETFVLASSETNYRPINPHFQSLFNSYYNSVGEQFPRSRRGLLTRPTVAEVYEYRHEVDRRLLHCLEGLSGDEAERIGHVLELGIHHEQQHQELILTDLKYLYSCNPLWPVYRPSPPEDRRPRANPKQAAWSAHRSGIVEIGHRGEAFCYDNEQPRHNALLHAFEIQDRLVTVGEFMEFMRDGGYRRPDLWLSLGWSTKNEQGWSAPLYWVENDGLWSQFTLHGLRELNPHEPVCHVSYFEADAFARWSGSRLPTEQEWEHVAVSAQREPQPHPKETAHFHPRPLIDDGDRIAQLFGEVWQWTSSPYTPYPGYRAAMGALGEYNGKFMCNQYVLRGSSRATPSGHARPTYRNFFPPDARWQFSGFRLTRDVSAVS